MTEFDAVVVGAGPNGLTAAATIARSGRSVLLVEAEATVGGGARSAELTLPGFVHDVCSAVHPFGAVSPVFADLPLARHGLRWAHPDLPLAHPLDGGRAAALYRSLDETVTGLGEDGRGWHRLVEPTTAAWHDLVPTLLGPVLRVPRHPVALARFGMTAVQSASRLAHRNLTGAEARGLFAGLAGHGFLPMEAPTTGAFGIVLAAAGHMAGWPFAAGGSGAVSGALRAVLEAAGGRVETGRRVTELGELPSARAVLLDVTPAQLVAMAGDRLPARYRRRLERFRYGPAVFKVDHALDGPVPWAAEACRRAGTVHVGGTMEEIAESERAVAAGRHPDRPFTLVAQPTLADADRAPQGRHVLWSYCHVPNGSTVDMTERIEAQIERFAPGFRQRIIGRHTMGPAAFERYDANYVGGDISGGAHDGLQLLLRPVVSPVPYATPVDGLYLCSSSTPPGAGVHGMCGYGAATAALRRSLR